MEGVSERDLNRISFNVSPIVQKSIFNSYYSQ